MFINFSKNIVMLLVAGLFAIGLIGCSKALEPAEVMSVEKVALDGYDPVAYFSASKAYKGDGVHSYSYKDLTWYFESDENLQSFSTDPESYMPQFGGFCAYALADGDLRQSDPQFWHIHNHKLYLFNDKEAKDGWFGEIDKMIGLSEQEWTQIMNPQEENK